jgi:ABC-type antimicrobial peptide transport system permease subunit
LGVVLAYLGSRLLAAQLFGVTADDTGSTLLSMAVLTAVVALATLKPMLRALRVDPVKVLRAE